MNVVTGEQQCSLEINNYFCNNSGKAAGGSTAQEADGGKRKTSGKAEVTESAAPSQYCHWLMKSEPESRFENGVDVKVHESVNPATCS